MTDTATEPNPDETFKQAMARLGIEEDTSGGSTVTFMSEKGATAAKRQAGQLTDADAKV